MQGFIVEVVEKTATIPTKPADDVATWKTEPTRVDLNADRPFATILLKGASPTRIFT